MVFTARDLLNILVSECFELCRLCDAIEVSKRLEVEAELALVCIAATENTLFLRKEEGVFAAGTEVLAGFDVNALWCVLTVTRIVGLKTESAVESLPPTVGGTVAGQCETMSISTCYLGNITNTVNKRGNINRAHLRVSNAQLRICIGSHSIDVATLGGTRHEDRMIITTGNLADLNIETAYLWRRMGHTYFSDTALPKVVIYNQPSQLSFCTYCPRCIFR